MTYEDLRPAPHSPEAEQAVLGCVFVDSRCAETVVEQLCPEDFFLQENREIFAFICKALSRGQPIDALTILKEMQEAGVSGDGTRDYLIRLMEIIPTSANVMEYTAIVREKAQLRAAREAEGEHAAK